MNCFPAMAYFESGQPEKAAQTERRALMQKLDESLLQKDAREVRGCQPTDRTLNLKDNPCYYGYDAFDLYVRFVDLARAS